MLSDFFQDWLINKLNGYFLVLYSNDHFILAWITECMNSIVVYILVSARLIPPRRRLSQRF
ncbi:MAG: hypothetical protein ACMUIU_09920 [bacterium]